MLHTTARAQLRRNFRWRSSAYSAVWSRWEDSNSNGRRNLTLTKTLPKNQVKISSRWQQILKVQISRIFVCWSPSVVEHSGKCTMCYLWNAEVWRDAFLCFSHSFPTIGRYFWDVRSKILTAFTPSRSWINLTLFTVIWLRKVTWISHDLRLLCSMNLFFPVIRERNALAISKSPFCVQLFYCLQNSSNIYMVSDLYAFSYIVWFTAVS